MHYPHQVWTLQISQTRRLSPPKKHLKLRLLGLQLNKRRKLIFKMRFVTIIACVTIRDAIISWGLNKATYLISITFALQSPLCGLNLRLRQNTPPMCLRPTANPSSKIPKTLNWETKWQLAWVKAWLTSTVLWSSLRISMNHKWLVCPLHKVKLTTHQLGSIPILCLAR